MSDSTSPPFIVQGAFNWSSLGYHYLLAPEDRLHLLSDDWSDDPWRALARVVELAKSGNFTEVGRLRKYFEVSKDVNVAPVALLVTGDLGSKSDLMNLAEVMRAGPDGLRVYACQGARNSGCAWLVPHMLDAWNRCRGADFHETIGFAIADLLDPISTLDELGPIGDRAALFDLAVDPPADESKVGKLALHLHKSGSSAVFNRMVMDRYAEVLDSCESEDDVLWAGRRSGVVELASYFLDMLMPPAFDSTQAPLTVVLREKFEAATGLNCSAFYRDGRFVQGEAVHTLEEFVASAPEELFRTGARYFFQHPLA